MRIIALAQIADKFEMEKKYTEKEVNDIIKMFGNYSKNQIVSRMHSERAYTETAPYDIIQYQYALELSID